MKERHPKWSHIFRHEQNDDDDVDMSNDYVYFTERGKN